MSAGAGGVNARELLEAASPRPWRTNEFVYWGANQSKADADDALLVQAVNEYESLLDVAEAASNAAVLEFNPSCTQEQNQEIASRAAALRDALARLDGIRGQHHGDTT